MSYRHTFVPLVVAGLTLAMVACGSKGSAPGTKSLDVKISDAGCLPADLKAAAGPTTFKVKNTGSSNVTEYEVLQNGKIIGEVENVSSGLTRSFSLDLKPGDYALACPNGKTSAAGKLTVTGSAAATSTDVANASATYKKYVESQAADLVSRTKTFTDAVIAGDIATAKAKYPQTREPYEKIEPVAESFGDLDPAIDGRADDGMAIGQVSGFHRLEYQMWTQNNLNGMAPVAQKLQADVGALRDKIAASDFEPAQIANGATELLGEVSKSKVTGEEERYSHTDLWDFAANVEGSEKAIDAVRPLLEKTDAQLSSTITLRYQDVQNALMPYKRGDGWAYYTELKADQVKALSQAIDALAEPVSQVAGKAAAAK